MADLDAFAALTQSQIDGLSVEIMAPDGKPVGLTIVIAGPDSDRVIEAQRAAVDRRDSEWDTKKQAAENKAVVAASVLSWSPLPVLGGQTLECTPENVLRVLNAIPFIYDQCITPVVSRAVFMKR